MRSIRYLLDCLHLSTAQNCCVGVLPVDGQETPRVRASGAPSSLPQKLAASRRMVWTSATELTVIANSDLDGGAAPDLPAGVRRLSERPAGCGVGAVGAADPAGPARRASPDRHGSCNKLRSILTAGRPPAGLSSERQLTA